MKPVKSVTAARRIEQRILIIRGQRVILSADLAVLYDVQARVLMQSVKRNITRFPDDFMFQLDAHEYANLKSQFVTSSWGGLRRALPYAFTEQGVAMLSSVLRSPRAVQVNIAIMRAFVRLREMLGSHKDLARKVDELEKKYDARFNVVFDAIRALMQPTPVNPKRRIGFFEPPSTSRAEPSPALGAPGPSPPSTSPKRCSTAASTGTTGVEGTSCVARAERPDSRPGRN